MKQSDEQKHNGQPNQGADTRLRMGLQNLASVWQ
jgi:hypothetical protein